MTCSFKNLCRRSFPKLAHVKDYWDRSHITSPLDKQEKKNIDLEPSRLKSCLLSYINWKNIKVKTSLSLHKYFLYNITRQNAFSKQWVKLASRGWTLLEGLEEFDKGEFILNYLELTLYTNLSMQMPHTVL